MKLKYIFTLLGVMLLGLTSCGKKDAPKTASNNPFAGTQWEYIQSSTDEQGERVHTSEIHFLDETHVVYLHSYKVKKQDGSIKESRESDKIEATYTYTGLVATSTVTNVDKETGKQQTAKFTFTMDEAKQKLTGVISSEGEKDQTLIFTRKK